MRYVIDFKDVVKTYRSKKYKWWFPIKPSTTLAGIVADLMCDGHLQDGPKGRIDLHF